MTGWSACTRKERDKSERMTLTSDSRKEQVLSGYIDCPSAEWTVHSAETESRKLTGDHCAVIYIYAVQVITHLTRH
jgi:hypothetical protein